MHPASSRRGTTFVRNPGAANEEIVTKTAVPMHRHRMPPNASAEQITRVFNELADDVHLATLAARSVPWVDPVVLEAVSFTNGQAITLLHRMETDRIAFELVDATGLAAGAPYATRTALDDKSITLLPAGTFVADVRFTMKP